MCDICNDRGYILPVGRSGPFRAELCECMKNCKKCDGLGFIFKMKNEYRYTEPCKVCGGVRRVVANLNYAKIPVKFAKATLDNYQAMNNQQKLAVQNIRGFLKMLKREKWSGIALSGPVGIGKTHLIVATAKELIEKKNRRVLFYNMSDLFASLKRAYDGRGDRTASDILDEIIKVDTLILDDLGKGRSDSDWEYNIVEEIISTRYSDGRGLLLVTTNYPITHRVKGAFEETLEDRIGPRAFSRLIEMTREISFTGIDIRRALS